MGYSIPAAIGARFAQPKKQIVAVCGDGSFQMSMMELATMRQHGIKIKIIVMNNDYLGMVREYQHYTYKDHYSVVNLDGSPDLEKLAPAFGIDYQRLSNMRSCDKEIKKFLDDKESVILECMVDPMDTVK